MVVSADVGVGKPDAAVFEHALSQLGVDGDDAVMVGDSLAKDVDGAIAAELRAVWLNRDGLTAPTDRTDLMEISTLGDLRRVLDDLDQDGET